MQNDLIGQRFADLVVESLAGTTANGNAQLWMCRCDGCDHKVLRTSAKLLAAARMAPNCHRCHNKPSSRSHVREMVEAGRRRLWEAQHTLYSTDALIRMEDDIRQEVAAETGCEVMEDLRDAGEVEDKPLTHGESRIDYAMTLEEIGSVLGITRERVRQIEERALRKVALFFQVQENNGREAANMLLKQRLRRNTEKATHAE